MIDRALVDRAKAGDQDAIADLYNRTYNPVYNTIRFILNDEDEVLDVLQDSYIKAFGSLDQLQEASKFEAWIKRIAHNKAIDLLRKAKPLNFSEMVSEDSDDVLEFEDDRTDNLPEVVMDQKETARLLGEILDSLPDDQRICVTMFYYDQLSVKEIAEELGVAEATVKSRLNYGRKKIESKVRDLEKKGTKLYGFAPIPFLLMLLRQELEISEVSVSGVLGSVLEALSGEAGAAVGAAAGTVSEAAGAAGAAEASGAGVGAAGAAAAAKGAAVVAGAAKLTLGTKIIAAVLAVAVIGGGGFAISKTMNKPPAEPAPAVEPAPEPEPAQDEAAEQEPEQEAQQETTEDQGTEVKFEDAFEDIRRGYEMCMAEGPNGSSPYLAYSEVAWTVENKNAYGAVMYALIDFNNDGTPEMVMGYPGLEDGGYTPFEVYAFDGEESEALTESFVKAHDYIHIAPDGRIWTHRGNGGDPICETYEIPAGTAELNYLGDFNMYEEDDPGDIQRSIEYNSILTPISQAKISTPADLGSNNSGEDDEMERHIKEQFGIPENYDCDVFIDWANMTYWEAAGRMVVHCTITHDGKEVASADINPVTGDLEKEIIAFSEG